MSLTEAQAARRSRVYGFTFRWGLGIGLALLFTWQFAGASHAPQWVLDWSQVFGKLFAGVGLLAFVAGRSATPSVKPTTDPIKQSRVYMVVAGVAFALAFYAMLMWMMADVLHEAAWLASLFLLLSKILFGVAFVATLVAGWVKGRPR